MKNIAITDAVLSDAQWIRKVQHDSWLETYPNEAFGITIESIQERVADFITPESVQRFVELLKDPNQHTWIARDGDCVVGYCVAEKSKGYNQLKALYVLAEFHGQKVGKDLIEHALVWLGTDRDIVLEAAVYNKRALRFYEKYGFKPTGKTGMSKDIPTVQLVKLHTSSYMEQI